MLPFRLEFLLLCATLLYSTRSAVMHSHSSHLNRERVQDGAYSPKDRGHLSDSGEHHNEFDHEAILGSVKEAEEFDHLTPEESKKRLAILLRKMDLNHDMRISRTELQAWILRSFKMLTEEEAQERLEDADEDSNGKVTWEEYVHDTYGMEDSHEFEAENGQLMKDDLEMWKVADSNGDNVLEGEEWVAFTHPEEHPAMIPFLVEQTLRDKDLDRDKSINFQEYIGDRGREHDKDWLHVEKDKFDHELDMNHDGKLTGEEIVSWLIPSNDDIAKEEVDHLFASSDDNHDDLLSFSEILDHHDLFVGSEATDYGDHLHNIHHFEDEL